MLVELDMLTKLYQELAERDEEELQSEVSGSIVIPGQRRVVGIGLIPPSEIAKAVRSVARCWI